MKNRKKRYKLKNWVVITLFYSEIIIATLLIINSNR